MACASSRVFLVGILSGPQSGTRIEAPFVCQIPPPTRVSIIDTSDAEGTTTRENAMNKQEAIRNTARAVTAHGLTLPADLDKQIA